MAKRVTLADVAERAGVSIATVDRVINSRRPVKASTVDAVRAAAEETGFYATSLLRQKAKSFLPTCRVGLVMQSRSNPFYRKLAGTLSSAIESAADIKGRPQVEFVDELSPAKIANTMRTMASEADILAVVGLDHPHVSDAITELKLKDVPTCAILSNLSSPDILAFVGTDGRKAGRTAAWLIQKCAIPGGAVAILVGSHRYTLHEDREGGFRSFAREMHCDFTILQTSSYADNASGAYESVRNAIQQNPDLCGIYLIGGGPDGAVQAVRESGRQDLTVICHQLNECTRHALIDGTIDMVLNTSVANVAEAATQVFARYARGPGQRHSSTIVPFDIYISENV